MFYRAKTSHGNHIQWKHDSYHVMREKHVAFSVSSQTSMYVIIKLRHISAMAPLIAGNSNDCPAACPCWQQKKHKMSALVTFCEGNTPVTRFPPHKASDAENVCISWRNHVKIFYIGSYQICNIAGYACAGNTWNIFLVTAGLRSRHASRHVCDARAVMHAGIVN